jgi:hypothetical protein
MKKVAATLKEIQGSEIYQRIMDPEDDLDDVIEEAKGWWRYDLLARNPSRAIMNEDGSLMKPTDLDLACFLAALAARGAVINLPVYTNRRPRQLRDDEWIVSKDNRHGKLVGLTSNKDVFSFSTLMIDANVVKTGNVGGKDGDQVGAFRNFMVVDLDGHFYDGWKTIEFVPSAKENDFAKEKGLWTGNKIFFDRFVHPNRWVSFYGQPYILTKLLIARLRAEARDLFQQVKAMKAELVVDEEDDGGDHGGGTSVGPSTTEKVKAFEAEVVAPIPETFSRKGTSLASREARLTEIETRLKKIRFIDVPELQFAVRATELAFCDRARCFETLGEYQSRMQPGGVILPATEPMPGWIKGAKFEDQLVKRTTWRRLVLHQAAPFATGLALRYRVKWKSERVAA